MSRYKLSHPKDTERTSALPRFTGGAVGFLAYDVVRHFEPRVQIPAADPQGLPEALFMFVDTLLVFDHLKHAIKVVAHCRLDGDVEPRTGRPAGGSTSSRSGSSQALPASAVPDRPLSTTSPSDVTSNVGREQLPSRRSRRRRSTSSPATSSRSCRRSGCRGRPSAHPFSIYRALRMVNPSPYMYYLQMGDAHIVGASPEMLVRVEDGVVETHPIAGTMPRGRDPDEDDAIAEELLADEKERAEHVMLVDLGRNDIGRVSQPGTVTVKDFMIVERYSHVMHLVSRVDGEAAAGDDARTTRCGPASRPARLAARPRSARWRSSPSWSLTGAGRTAAPSATSTSPATWTPRSRSARWS